LFAKLEHVWEPKNENKFNKVSIRNDHFDPALYKTSKSIRKFHQPEWVSLYFGLINGLTLFGLPQKIQVNQIYIEHQ